MLKLSWKRNSLDGPVIWVRSTQLDKWTVEQVDFMEKMGNERANLYWEMNLPVGARPKVRAVQVDPKLTVLGSSAFCFSLMFIKPQGTGTDMVSVNQPPPPLQAGRLHVCQGSGHQGALFSAVS